MRKTLWEGRSLCASTALLLLWQTTVPLDTRPSEFVPRHLLLNHAQSSRRESVLRDAKSRAQNTPARHPQDAAHPLSQGGEPIERNLAQRLEWPPLRHYSYRLKVPQTVVERVIFFVKIFVTGGAGYIGGTVAQLLTERGHEAVVFDNLNHGRRDLVPSSVTFIHGDLADRQALESIFNTARESNQPFDGVLHFAALIEAGESMQRPEIYFRNNTAGTLSLLEAMLACGLHRFVFSSTAAVYGEPESIPIQEDARLSPTNPYGQSKLLVEQMLAWFNRIYGLKYASLRYFNVAGAPEGPNGVTRGEAHEPESHLIPLILDVALGRRPSIRMYGDDYPTPDGTCIRDYIHVSDLAEAHLLALAALGDATEKQPPLVYNLGNGQGFSVRDVVSAARRVTGRPIPEVIHPRRPGDPAVLVASSAKAMRELGWKPRYTNLDDIVRTAWLWHQQRYSA
jgi:UDP-glucose 4-epimerase